MKASPTRHLCYLLFCTLSIVPFIVPLRAEVRLALHNESYSLVLAIPLLSLALLYLRRRTIFTASRAAPAFAVPVLLAGLPLAVFSRSLALSILALVLTWIGGFVLCYGVRPFRAARFPLLFLALMIPIPKAALDTLTGILQAGSAEWAYCLFRVLGVPIFREGFLFSLPGVNIEVAGQCSSIRSSTALFITSLLVGYLFLPSVWRRICLSLTALPLAIFTNGIRIVTLSSLAVYVDQSFLYGRLHHEGGALFSLISVILLLAVLFILRGSWTRGLRSTPAPAVTRLQIHDVVPR